jgi:hypothetical protein
MAEREGLSGSSHSAGCSVALARVSLCIIHSRISRLSRPHPQLVHRGGDKWRSGQSVTERNGPSNRHRKVPRLVLFTHTKGRTVHGDDEQSRAKFSRTELQLYCLYCHCNARCYGEIGVSITATASKMSAADNASPWRDARTPRSRPRVANRGLREDVSIERSKPSPR